MPYLITYHDRNHELQNIEWVVPTGWSEAAIQQSFAEQYPNATLIAIKQLEG